jgi:hypothetical protein
MSLLHVYHLQFWYRDDNFVNGRVHLFSGLIKGRRVVNGRHRLRASSQLSRVANDPKQLADLDGRALITPAADLHHPHKSHLTWHRKEKFHP